MIHKNEVIFSRLESIKRRLTPAGRRYIKSIIHEEILNYAQRALIAVDDQYPMLRLFFHMMPPCPNH